MLELMVLPEVLRPAQLQPFPPQGTARPRGGRDRGARGGREMAGDRGAERTA